MYKYCNLVLLYARVTGVVTLCWAGQALKRVTDDAVLSSCPVGGGGAVLDFEDRYGVSLAGLNRSGVTVATGLSCWSSYHALVIVALVPAQGLR